MTKQIIFSETGRHVGIYFTDTIYKKQYGSYKSYRKNTTIEKME